MTSTNLAPARVSLRHVNRTFGTHTVPDDVDIEIEPGEVVALLGSSGSGKSTLLRLVAGLDRPTGGRIEIDGAAVRGNDPRCAMVFQEPRLLPWRSLAANVAFGVPAGTSRSKSSAAVQHWLDVVGLREFGNHYPRQVSGGMAQRAGLARALARGPRVLLLDEPLAALDALTRLRMQDLLDSVQQEAGTSVDRIRQGRIGGPPEIRRTAGNDEAAQRDQRSKRKARTTARSAVERQRPVHRSAGEAPDWRSRKRWGRVKQQHGRAVHGEQLVVLLVGQELQPGSRQLKADQ